MTFLFISLPSAHSAINYVSEADIYSSNASTSMVFTTSANTNRILIFGAGINDDRPEYDITSISYGSQFFTLLTRTASGPGDGTGITAELWYLINPNSGAGSITVSQANAMGKSIGVIEYSGVDSIGSSNTAMATALPLAASLTTTQSRSWITGVFSERNSSKMTVSAVTFGLVIQWNRQGKTPAVNIYNRSVGHDLPTIAAGLYNLEFNSNKNDYCGMAVAELKAAKATVISCLPAVGYTGGGTSVTITGTNFDNGCTLTIGGNTAVVNFVNSTTLRIDTPAHAAGLVDVVVTNLDAQSATGTAIFNYSPFQAPVVSSCLPVSGSTLGGQAVTITGSNFISGCTVTIGGLVAAPVIFVNATTLIVTTPANAAGLKSIVVTNPDTQTGTLTNGYTYVLPPPQVTSCSPVSGLTTGGQQITIVGKYFVNGCTATIGGTSATGVTFINTMTLRVTTPANGAGAANVAVRNSDAQTGTLVSGFTYFVLPPPLAVSCLPASGPTTGGQSITLSGSNFVSGCTASIGGAAATGINFINALNVAMTTPAHIAGTVGIVITNPDTQSSILAAAYTYAMPPAVLSCAPVSGSTAGGQTMTVTGTNFRAGCSATLDGIPCAVTRVSTAQLLLTTPAHAGGAVDVKVSNTDYTSGTLAGGFTYDGTPPVITLNGGGADITIATGDTYAEVAAASDNLDGDVTAGMIIVIKDHLGTVTGSVVTDAPEIYTITYDVSDTASNAAVRVTRTVHVTDQAAPVIDLNSASDITLGLGDTYTEAATAVDNIDGDLTGSMTVVIKDHLGTTVGSVSTVSPETYTITYNVSDAALNAALQKTRTVHVINVPLASIAITVPASKLVFKTGEPLTIAGMVVTGTYDDFSTAVLSVTTANVTGFNSSTAVTGQVLTVTINGKSTTYTVDIIALVSIAITTPAAKLVYDIGQALSVAGMVVTGTYSNSSTAPVTVTTANVTGFSSAAAQTGQVLTVTYGGKTTNYTVDIVPTLVSIAITTPASKLVYDIGEPLSISGMVVTGTYTDSSQKIESIIPANVTGLDTSAAEMGQVLTVTKNGKTATYTVDIVPTLASIAITTPASKLVFNVGDALSIAGMVVTGTYTDGNTKQETVTAGNVTGFNSTVPATGKVLTVTVGSKFTTYTVDIVQPLLVSIAITTPATKLVYTVGDALDIAGMVITGTYDDFSTKNLPVILSNVTGFNSSAPAASQVLTVTIGGKSKTYNVQILSAPPFVDVCLPVSGPSAGGTAITVYGGNFVNGCTVTIGGTPATAVAFVDDMTLTMNTPAHAYGIVGITVTNPDTQAGTGTGLFTYTGPTFTPTGTQTRTRTATITPTVTRTVTNTTAATGTNTPVYSKTITPTITRTSTAGPSSTITATSTVTSTGTGTHTRTVTPTGTGTSTQSATKTITQTRTGTSTATDTATQSATKTITQTHTDSPTNTVTPTITVTRTVTVSPTVTETKGYNPAASGNSYVFPQPAINTLNIIYFADTAADARIFVYNAAGMPVADYTNASLPGNTNKAVLDIKKLSNGIYYYIIRVGNVNYKPNKFLVSK